MQANSDEPTVGNASTLHSMKYVRYGVHVTYTEWGRVNEGVPEERPQVVRVYPRFLPRVRTCGAHVRAAGGCNLGLEYPRTALIMRT